MQSPRKLAPGSKPGYSVRLRVFFATTTAIEGDAFRPFWFFDHVERVKRATGKYPDYDNLPYRRAATLALRASPEVKARSASASASPRG